MSVLIVVIAALVAGFQIGFHVNQRTQTAEAFVVLRTVDDRIHLSSEIPNMTRTESGVAVRFGGSGEGPSINYSFFAARTPDWQRRLNAAMKAAGYGNGNSNSWEMEADGYDVTVIANGPEAPSKNAFVTISTL